MLRLNDTCCLSDITSAHRITATGPGQTKFATTQHTRYYGDTRPWDCYMAKRIEFDQLEQGTEMLRSANSQLCLRLQSAERELFKQSAFLAYSEQLFAHLQRELKILSQFWDSE